ncbi:Helix-turn-helix domain protein [Phycisphaerae bacterium RAS1]|nr:Helix-turn-helix domain protein [Phycisphaerae bacterium RAS1]
MNQPTNTTPSNGDLLHVLQQIECHLAALRHGAAAPRPDWMTVEEVANELRLSRDSVERLIACGRLQAAEVTGVAGRGRRRRFRVRREWIDDFLKSSVKHHATTRTTRRSPARNGSTIDFIQ